MANRDSYIINAKGRRTNDKGGWKKYLTRKRRDQIIKNIITYSNIGFGAINIAILIYSLNQDSKLEHEVARQRIELEKQHEIGNESKIQIDSLRNILSEQRMVVLKLDSSARAKSNAEEQQPKQPPAKQ